MLLFYVYKMQKKRSSRIKDGMTQVLLLLDQFNLGRGNNLHPGGSSSSSMYKGEISSVCLLSKCNFLLFLDKFRLKAKVCFFS